jgi:hypothetical protein
MMIPLDAGTSATDWRDVSAIAKCRFGSEWLMPEVDLAFIARQLERLVNDIAGLKDDMVVVIARLDRLDATTHSLVTEVRAMHGRHDRVLRRVERLEEADREAPS